MNNMTMDEEKKLRAAYTLNMCAVSIAQIVDYNDINILDQEYNAILNNLNIEEVPKDDELKDLFEDMLRVITHIKINEMEKQFIEKEYQLKMKNAIWSSVPNFGMIIAGGKPWTIAVSLVNQIGIGYMNYRKNKEEYGLGRDRELWQLKKIQMEQFDHIQRKLFGCAWKLADTYNFPDKYRLSEQQIKDYNKILRDTNLQRKYERLEAVKNDFEAYPPFWYFIGNAANSIANDPSSTLSDSSRAEYRHRALEYFETFENVEKKGILRTSPLSASCALEHVELLLAEKTKDKNKISELLKKAERMSKNSFDSLQLCAITYIRTGNSDEAAGILRRLVNEDYNKVINAQMLSAIYARNINKYRTDYETLARRVNDKYLFPMPDDNYDIKLLEDKFEARMKNKAKLELNISLDNFVEANAVKWNKILSNFDVDKQYSDAYFLDNEEARNKRRNEAQRILGNTAAQKKYLTSISTLIFGKEIHEIIQNMKNALFSLRFLNDAEIKGEVDKQINAQIRQKEEIINTVQRSIIDSNFDTQIYNRSQELVLSSIVFDAIAKVKNYGSQQIDRAVFSDIPQIESELTMFCTREGIETPEVAIENHQSPIEEPSSSEDIGIYGHEGYIAWKNSNFRKSMALYMKNHIENINSNDKAEFILMDTLKFQAYFKGFYKGDPSIASHTVTILHSTTNTVDLMFTTDGIVDVQRDKPRFLTHYNEVEMKGDDTLLLFRRKYKNKSVDMLSLYSIIQDLSTKFVRNLNDIVEYIPGVIDIKILKWFQSNKGSFGNDIKRVIAIPSKDNLEHFGFPSHVDFDTDKNLFQCYYDKNTGNILKARIIRSEGIDSKLMSLLIENDGIMYIKND